jgi:hypothetical protein
MHPRLHEVQKFIFRYGEEPQTLTTAIIVNQYGTFFEETHRGSTGSIAHSRVLNMWINNTDPFAVNQDKHLSRTESKRQIIMQY